MLRKIWLITGIVIVTAVAAEIAFRANLLEGLENVYDDLWHQAAGLRSQPAHTVIAVIDDLTLRELNDEPLVFWSPYFAQAIQVLREAGAAVIGLDIVFAVSAEAWFHRHFPDDPRSRNYDNALRAQLAQGNVILAGQLTPLETGEQHYLVSLEDYLSMLPGQAADVGLINMYPDPDGVVRHFIPAFTGAEANAPGLGFGTLLALRAAGLDPASATWTINGVAIPHTSAPRRIRFSGPPNSVPRLSFARLLSPHAADDPDIQRLKDKVVIIAAEALGTQDLHQTPYSRTFFGRGGQFMAGPELHANIIETLLTGRFPRPIPFWSRWLFLAGVLTLATVLFFRCSPWQGVGSGVLLGAACALPAYLLFCADWLLPVANVQMGIGLSYLATLGLRLTGEERERARVRTIFEQFVSDDVVKRLVTPGKMPDLGGEAYQVTVLFSDIRNFTPISEKLRDPQHVVMMLNAYFSEVNKAILEQGGIINKYIGDAVMAIFGAPEPLPDHARRALKAALAMQRIAQDFRAWMQQHFPDRDLPEFRIGIGLHTGNAVIGNVGSAQRMEYTAIGDTVNTASRLESASKDLGWTIVASTATITAAGPDILTSGHETIHVKGREQAVEVFEVIGVKV